MNRTTMNWKPNPFEHDCKMNPTCCHTWMHHTSKCPENLMFIRMSKLMCWWMLMNIWVLPRHFRSCGKSSWSFSLVSANLLKILVPGRVKSSFLKSALASKTSFDLEKVTINSFLPFATQDPEFTYSTPMTNMIYETRWKIVKARLG